MKTNKPQTLELWCVDKYVKDAYVDHTGAKQQGNVVYERVMVEFTGRFDQFEEYGQDWHKDAGITAIERRTGRMFKGIANLVDYYGVRHWILEPANENQKGHWEEAPINHAGYCYPDGSAAQKLSAQELAKQGKRSETDRDVHKVIF